MENNSQPLDGSEANGDKAKDDLPRLVRFFYS